MDPRTKLIEILMTRLRHVDTRKEVVTRMRYRTLPWVTDRCLEGVPIRTLMTPLVTGCGRETESVFDVWCVSVREGANFTMATRDLCDYGHRTLSEFLRRNSTTLEEGTVLLLCALGNADGATFEYTLDRVLVTHDGVTFGIREGVAESRFSSGLRFDGLDPIQVLEATHETQAYDEAFVRLYREAYNVGDDAVEALIALRTGDRRFNFGAMLGKCRLRVAPRVDTLARIERGVMTKRDPLMYLYSEVVPRWFRPFEFNTVIAKLSGRQLDPPQSVRLKYVTNFYEAFHKNNKKESACASL